MGVSRSDECAERVLAMVRPRYLVKLAVAGTVGIALSRVDNICTIESKQVCILLLYFGVY